MIERYRGSSSVALQSGWPPGASPTDDTMDGVPDWAPDADRGPASLAARVLGQLRRDILSVRFNPGAKLPLKVLAHDYDVGLTPLREALALLCGAGLVLQESQRGFTVAPVSAEDFADIAACRRRLEPMCLALAIAQGDDGWRRRIEGAHRRFAPVAPRVGENAPIDEAWEAGHRAYHFALISACGSPALLGFCMQLHDRYDRYRRLSVATKSLMAGTGGDHEEIAEAALAGDADRATRLLDRHIATTTELIAEAWPAGGRGLSAAL